MRQHDGRGKQRAEGSGLPQERVGNAEISPGQRAEKMHEANAEVQHQRHKHGRKHGGRGPDGERQQRGLEKISSKPVGDFRIFSIRSDVKISPLTGKAHDFYVIEAPIGSMSSPSPPTNAL